MALQQNYLLPSHVSAGLQLKPQFPNSNVKSRWSWFVLTCERFMQYWIEICCLVCSSRLLMCYRGNTVTALLQGYSLMPWLFWIVTRIFVVWFFRATKTIHHKQVAISHYSKGTARNRTKQLFTRKIEIRPSSFINNPINKYSVWMMAEIKACASKNRKAVSFDTMRHLNLIECIITVLYNRIMENRVLTSPIKSLSEQFLFWQWF